MTNHVTIQQAATTLGISAKTVRRRLKTGQLKGQLIDGRWSIDLPMSNPESDTIKQLQADLTATQAERDWLRTHVEQLTVTNMGLITTIHNFEQRLLPSGEADPKRPWWKIWK